MFNYVSNKPKVYKVPSPFGASPINHRYPWMVMHPVMHPIGFASFPTWREAMDYALCPLVQINGYRTTGLYA